MTFRLMDMYTKQEVGEERVIALRMQPLRLEFYSRSVSTGARVHWAAPVAPLQAMMPKLVQFGGSSQQVAGQGWISPAITETTAESLWAALDNCTRNPQNYKDVSNALCTDGAGFLVRRMTINATGKTVEEHIRSDKIKGEMTFRLMDMYTKQEVGEERVIALRMQPLRLEFYSRSVSTGARLHWAAPVAPLQAMMPKLVQFEAMTAAPTQVVGQGWISPAITATTAEGLWAALDNCARNPQNYKDVSNVVCTDGAGFLVRRM